MINLPLRPILAFDALTCIAMGAGLLAAAAPLAGLLALPVALLSEAGIALLAFALFVLWARHVANRSIRPARAVAWLNLGWTGASLALLAIVTPNLLGTAFILAQALAVAGIAALQLRATSGATTATA